MKPYLTKHRMEVLIEALKDLLERATRGAIPCPYSGICSNLDHLLIKGSSIYAFSEIVNLVMYLAVKWPESVSPGQYLYFPVPTVAGYGKWEGPNLQKRISLMKYMLKRLKDWHRRAKP